MPFGQECVRRSFSLPHVVQAHHLAVLELVVASGAKCKTQTINIIHSQGRDLIVDTKAKPGTMCRVNGYFCVTSTQNAKSCTKAVRLLWSAVPLTSNFSGCLESKTAVTIPTLAMGLLHLPQINPRTALSRAFACEPVHLLACWQLAGDTPHVLLAWPCWWLSRLRMFSSCLLTQLLDVGLK